MNELSFDDLTGQMMDLYREGNYAEALQIVERNADRFPDHSARTTFWKMCLLSLCGRPNDMISVFRQGLDSGLWWSKNVFNDSDLNAVRDLPAFQRLMQESQEKYEAVRTQMERDHAVLVPDEPAAEAYPLLIALHGRNGNKESNRREWEAARRKGWLVLLTQSTQPLFPGSYCWDEPAQSLADLLFYYEQICSRYPVEPQHIVLAGFSQGSGMAIHAALDGRIPVCGFISVAIGWSNFEGVASLAANAGSVRGYFVIGEKDHTLQSAHKIRAILKNHNVAFAEEVHPDVGHEFPPDFEKSFDQAIEFIFKEHE